MSITIRVGGNFMDQEFDGIEQDARVPEGTTLTADEYEGSTRNALIAVFDRKRSKGDTIHTVELWKALRFQVLA